jgi:O-antigen/teichoic acid export membrane protein
MQDGIKAEMKESPHFHTAVSGFAWMLSGAAGVQAMQLAVNLVLARLLVPSDFGAVAIVTALIGILQTFAELGVSVAIVQRKELPRTVTDSAFVLTLFVTLIIVFALWLTSRHIARFFHLPVLGPLLTIAALSYLFHGLYALYHCLMLRNMEYKAISRLEIKAYAVYGMVAVVLAWLGFGPFSMVYAGLVWSLLLLSLGVLKTGYIPKGAGNLKIMRELVSFGMWVSLGRVLRNSSARLSNFIIGKSLSASALGIYSMTEKIVMILPTTYSMLIDQVMLPIYSKWQEEPARIEENYFKVLEHASLILVAPLCLIFVFADPLVRILLGDKWIQAIPIVRIISLFGLTQVFGEGILDSVVYSQGRPRIVTIMNLFKVIALPTFLIVGCYWGLVGVAWGLVSFGLLGRLFNQWLVKKYFGYSLRRYFLKIFPAAASAVAATAISSGVITIGSEVIGAPRLLNIFVSFWAWAAAYYGCARFFAPQEVKTLTDMFIQYGQKYKNPAACRRRCTL